MVIWITFPIASRVVLKRKRPASDKSGAFSRLESISAEYLMY
jgi:hypothetical protein